MVWWSTQIQVDVWFSKTIQIHSTDLQIKDTLNLILMLKDDNKKFTRDHWHFSSAAERLSSPAKAMGTPLACGNIKYSRMV